MIKYIFLILLVFINNCSFNSNSKFWTKEKKVEQLSKNVKKIFEDEKEQTSVHTHAAASDIRNFDKSFLSSQHYFI